MDENELEPEVLTYREFTKRQTLLAWRRRLRAHELNQDEEKTWVDAPARAQDPDRDTESAPARKPERWCEPGGVQAA
jgi:hypothetical protein